ncbi:MAG: sugar nucleotide-binding protein, partial [Vicinamibacteria bacterium]
MADVLVIGGDAGLGAEVLRAARSAGYAAAPCPREVIAAADDADCDRLVLELGRHAVLDVGEPVAADAGRMARAAARAGALSVLTSWIDVFDGHLQRPYVESDEPWPTTASGRARLATERAVAHANERHVIFRLGWVLGISGPPIDDLAARLGPEGTAVYRLVTNTDPEAVPTLI